MNNIENFKNINILQYSSYNNMYDFLNKDLLIKILRAKDESFDIQNTVIYGNEKDESTIKLSADLLKPKDNNNVFPYVFLNARFSNISPLLLFLNSESSEKIESIPNNAINLILVNVILDNNIINIINFASVKNVYIVSDIENYANKNYLKCKMINNFKIQNEDVVKNNNKDVSTENSKTSSSFSSSSSSSSFQKNYKNTYSSSNLSSNNKNKDRTYVSKNSSYINNVKKDISLSKKEKVLIIIKPHIIDEGSEFMILDRIIANGFEVSFLSVKKLSKKNWEDLYINHKSKDFYLPMCEKFSERRVYIAILEKIDAINSIRELIGVTNPFNASKHSIRRLFGTSIEDNAIHASDSYASYEKETKILFNK